VWRSSRFCNVGAVEGVENFMEIVGTVVDEKTIAFE
jgi:hypothetical protein